MLDALMSLSSLSSVSWCRISRVLSRSFHDGLPKHRVTPFNRIILKITRTVADPVPKEVSFEMMDKANSRFRIGTTTIVMIGCIFGSMYSIQQGRKSAGEHRDSIYQQNRDRHSKDQSAK